MSRDDDEIPDLFGGPPPAPAGPPRARGAPTAPVSTRPAAPRVAGPTKTIEAPTVLRTSFVPPSFPSTGLSLDLDALAEPESVADEPAEDEFDLLAATSLRSNEFSSVAPPAPTAAALGSVSSSRARPSVPPARFEVAQSDESGPASLDLAQLDASPLEPSHPVSSRPVSPRPVSPRGDAQRPEPSRAPSKSFPPPPATTIEPALPPGLAGAPSGGNVLDWDLDEALGIAPAAGLVVATEVPTSTENDGPWPDARTPAPEEHAISFEEARAASGYGPPPRGFFAAPLYFLRVTSGKKALDENLKKAAAELDLVERKRDARVAALAEALRPELGEKDRFSELYAGLDRHEAAIGDREASLRSVDRAGADFFAEHEARLGEARKRTEALREVMTARRLVADEAARATERARALVSRFEIEKRNVEELARKRAPEGGFMPPDLAARYQYLEKDWADAKQKWAEKEAEQKAQLALFREAEDEHRRAVATEQRIEGEREGYLIAHEGQMSDRATLLDEARRSRLGTLARAGRVILDLRGEVKVERSVREEIQELDREVREAARKAELMRRASIALDRPAYERGKTFFVVLGVLFVAFLVYGLLF